ncbi:MAG: hypothetical protein CFH37_00243, partial [Alphaproteobacteria bacterium MarineAlpha9_Bin7]
RALDRVLLWGHYVVPHWHIRSFRLVYWNMFGKPETPPKYGISFPNTWWYDEGKHQLLSVNKIVDGDIKDATQTQSSNMDDQEGIPETSPPDELAKAERDTMVYLASLGIMIVIIMLYLRRRAKKSS